MRYKPFSLAWAANSSISSLSPPCPAAEASIGGRIVSAVIVLHIDNDTVETFSFIKAMYFSCCPG
jgi:hypothetical protein